MWLTRRGGAPKRRFQDPKGRLLVLLALRLRNRVQNLLSARVAWGQSCHLAHLVNISLDQPVRCAVHLRHNDSCHSHLTGPCVCVCVTMAVQIPDRVLPSLAGVRG